LRRPRIAVVALALGCAALPARAQFYSLEGRFECLDDPRALCGDVAPQATAPAPPASVAAALAPRPPLAASGQGGVASAHPTPPLAPAAAAHHGAAAASADPVREIVQRLQAGHPAPDDPATLRRLADRGDRRALELLAWSSLKGLGTARDPVRAFLLYGLAADLGVAAARHNQAIIYETELTSEQRQQVLMIANGTKSGS